ECRFEHRPRTLTQFRAGLKENGSISIKDSGTLDTGLRQVRLACSDPVPKLVLRVIRRIENNEGIPDLLGHSISSEDFQILERPVTPFRQVHDARTAELDLELSRKCILEFRAILTERTANHGDVCNGDIGRVAEAFTVCLPGGLNSWYVDPID